MTEPMPRQSFQPNSPDAAGVISWIHIGDLHMTQAGEQNHKDLIAIVDKVNRVFAQSIAFVYMPGDIAEHGDSGEYQVVRSTIDHLEVPWCSIVGDHDVQEKTFTNYLNFARKPLHYAFTVGKVRFVALNAFDFPHPASFCLLPNQLEWLQSELRRANNGAVLFLHCYPSDLKQGSEQLRKFLASSVVRLIDMGHTHYNEIANDGRTLYTATRSTGQVEEGPIGFSIANIDHGVISWRFLELLQLPVVMITFPADERLLTDSIFQQETPSRLLYVRAKAWGNSIQRVWAEFEGSIITLNQIAWSNVWESKFPIEDLADGIYPLRVVAEDSDGQIAADCIRIVFGSTVSSPRQRAPRDQDNALEPWPEHGLLGTQLGPNKNGRKW